MIPLEIIALQVPFMFFFALTVFIIVFLEGLLFYGSFKLVDSHPGIARFFLFLMLILPLFLLFFII